MKERLVINDIKANKLSSISTLIFMAICSLLIALTCFLFSDISGAVSSLMTKAQTPDFLQMHTGDIDEGQLAAFANSNKNVGEYQVLKFLNIENGTIILGKSSLADSTQDNGVCVQSGKFDFLLDTDDNKIEAKDGEVYVPVCYRDEYGLKVGDGAKFGTVNFTVADFLKDSQMNSMMASSKRFLISQGDYDRLQAEGSEEYIIEFLLAKGGNANALAADYADAGLPNNGPAITKPLISLMNSLSVGMTALVILLVSIVMLLISILCIRFTLLSKLEADKREIGMLKAIGISRGDINRLYLLKYLLLSAIGAVVGLIAGYIIKHPLEAGLRTLYGIPAGGAVSFLIAVLGAALAEGIIILSVFATTNRFEKLSAIDALNGRETVKRKKAKRTLPVEENPRTPAKKGGRIAAVRAKLRVTPQTVLIIFVLIASVFLMTVPQNLNSTLSSPKFVTYMGIGNADVRIDIRQSDNLAGQTEEVKGLLSSDNSVQKYVLLLTKSYHATLSDDTRTNLSVEQGDHSVFPVVYASGRAPANEGEIALSYLAADDLKLAVSDTIKLNIDNTDRPFKVCGIYSDITNGGKTAKTVKIDDGTAPMWSIFYLTLNGQASGEWVKNCESTLASHGINAKTVDITTFVRGIFGQTMKQISLASALTMCAAAVVILVVVALFTNLLVAKDKNEISLKKALGFTNKDIVLQYALRFLTITLVGIVSGVLLGNILGQGIAGILLKTLGAVSFKFVIDWLSVLLIIPLIALAASAVATLLGLSAIRKIKANECCMWRE